MGVCGQISLLFGKNLQLARRAKAKSLFQVLIGVLFITLVWALQLVLDANTYASVLKFNPHPEGQVLPAIPLCLPHAEKTCHSFVYSPLECYNVSKRIAANSGLPLEGKSAGPKGFATAEDMELYLFDHPNTTQVAFEFGNCSTWKSGSAVSYVLIGNETGICSQFHKKCSSPMRDWIVPAQRAADEAILQTVGGSTSLKINMTFQPFPHPDLPLKGDAMLSFGVIFILTAMTFNMIVQLSTLVEEKEKKLVSAMECNGMAPVAYWISWYAFELIVNALVVLAMSAMGFILQLDFFVKNSFLVYFLLLFLYATSLTCLSHLLNAFLSRSQNARTAGTIWLIFSMIVGNIAALVLYANNDYKTWQTIASFVSPAPFIKGMMSLISLSSGESKPGVSFGQIDSTDPIFSLLSVFKWLLIDCGFYTFLGIYLNAVLPKEEGRSHSPLFFLQPSFWCGQSGNDYAQSVLVRADDDPDVRAEAVAVRDGAFGQRQAAVVIKNLVKTFRSFGCPKKEKGCGRHCHTSKQDAVDAISFAIDEGQCLVLLGHNGAGKTTTIRMLTGQLDPTAGDATLFGNSISSTAGLQRIRRFIGLCPQHDILFDDLTGRENLCLFASLKGVSSDGLASEVSKRLAEVELVNSADRLSSTYSGGMRRRLSLAIALLGDPRVVFLDECTTGMDPVTRSQVWQMIERAKKGRVILLTTHSMREADVLGDRIAIMSAGRLQALGSSLRLKNRFGSGYSITVLRKGRDNDNAIFNTIGQVAPMARCVASDMASLKINLPPDAQAVLPQLFALLESNAGALHISDLSLELSSLEEVFLNLSSEDELRRTIAGSKMFKCASCSSKASVSGEIALKANKMPLALNTPTPIACCKVCETSQHLPALAFMWQAPCVCGKQHIIPAGRRCKGCDHCGKTVSGGGDTASGSSCVSVRNAPTIVQGNPMNAGAEGESWVKPTTASKFSQFKALAGKTITLQKRNRMACVCMVILPLYFLAILFLIQTILASFDHSGDYDIDCLNALLRANYPLQESADLSLTVGSPSLLNPLPSSLQGSGYGFEKVDWNIPVSGSAGLGYTAPANASMKEQSLDIMKSLSDVVECQRTYMLDVYKDMDLTNTYNYLHQNDTKSDFLLSKCLTPAARKKGGAPSGSSSGDWKPTDALMKRLDLARKVRDECQANGTSAAYGGLAKLAAFVDAQQGSHYLDRIGLLGKVSTQSFKSSEFDRMGAIVVATVQAQGFPQVKKFSTDICGNSSMKAAIRKSAPYVDGLCWAQSNLDAFRQLNTSVAAASASTLENDLYDDWFGKLQDGLFFSKPLAFDIATSGGAYKISAYYNQTGSATLGDINGFANWPAAQWLVDNAIFGAELGNATLSVKSKTFPTKFDKDTLKPLGGMSLADTFGGSFYPIMLLVSFPFFCQIIVLEKESKIQQLLKMMGLSQGVYWSCTSLIMFLEYCCQVALLWVVGAQMGLNFFLIHDSLLLLSIFAVWGVLLVSMTLLFCAFFTRVVTATLSAALIMFISIMSIGQVLASLDENPETPESSYWAYQWFPFASFTRLVSFLSQAAAWNEPITFDNWSNTPCPMLLGLMIVQAVVCLLLFGYFESVLAMGFGSGKHPLFCCMPACCRGNKKRGRETDAMELLSNPVGANHAALPADLKTEESRVFRPPTSTKGRDQAFLKVKRIHKIFPASGINPMNIAVSNLSFGVNYTEVFGLLGENGAGKSTTINMLCGLISKTSGTADVGDLSIDRDFGKIHSLMGVCPQFDILWDRLTAEEHLLFYGRLKGLRGAPLKREVAQVLESVHLGGSTAKKEVRAFSGGMKRRLSVAISLIAMSRLVYLDEPSTGLDPASRRSLWNVIREAKASGSRSIVLTTHAMEEANALCDRVGIMSASQLRCIGTPAELKNRYGAGYTLLISSCNPAAEVPLQEFVRSQYPSANLLGKPVNGCMKWEVLRNEVRLSTLFPAIEGARKQFGIVDWGITESSLEEVFLRTTKPGFS